MQFNDKVVLITGGSRGIGRAIAHAFANEGATVIINYRINLNEAEVCIKQLRGTGHLAIKTDIGNAIAVKNMVDTVISEFGRIDILVNNAGIHEYHPIDVVSYDKWQKEWRKTLDVNLVGAANVTYCVAQHMIAKKIGRIVFVGSRGAFRGEPAQPAYGASKAGIHAFGQSIAQALAPYDIGVGIVAPGFVETEMVEQLLKSDAGDQIRAQSPFNRVAKPDEVASAVLYLSSAKSIWCSGTIIDVNGASYLRS